MPTFVTEAVQTPARVADAVPARKTKLTLKRIVIVTDPEHDLAWLGRLRAASFEPVLLTSNFDAVQMLAENPELRIVLFAQRSMMMDGIAACQLLRQSRSEDDVAIVLMLNEDLDQSVIEAFAAGVSDVVCHPFHTAELIARLEATRQRLMLWGDTENGAPGFQAEPAVSSSSAPHFGGSHQTKQPPASPERVTTRLAGDWLLTHDLPHGISAPTLDLSQLKFVSSLTAPQVESARQRGELNEVLLDRVWVCPQCRALPSFRPACPCCGSAGVERDRMLHHFACAFVGATSEFQLTDEGLSCPKCCTQRLMVGTDCEFLDGPFRCSDCDWSAAELEIVGHCLKCGFRFPAQQAALEELVGFCSAHADEELRITNYE